jgi:WD40 repeat protein
MTDQIIIAICCNNSIHICQINKTQANVLSYQNLHSIHNSGENLTASYFPQLKYLAVGSSQKNIKIWLLSENFTRSTIICTLNGHLNSVRCVAFHPNSSETKVILASGSIDSTTILWTIPFEKGIVTSTNYLTTIFREHTRSVNTVFFHPLTFNLVTGSSDGTVKIWPL